MRLALAGVVSGLLTTAAVASDVPAPSKIDSVIVFPSGAEVARIARVTLEKGDHTLVLDDLPASAIPDSIRVEGKASGRLDIGSVDTRRLMVTRSEGSETEHRRIEDEIERLQDERTVLEAQRKAAETQQQLVANLAQLPSRPAPAAGVPASKEDWTAIFALIGSASVDAQRVGQEATIKIRGLDRVIEELSRKLDEVAPAREERTEVRVHVAADTPLDAEVVVRYQVPNASWTPFYDARLTTGSKTVAPKLALVRRAAISQRTGEAWEDVAVTLSTTRPSAGAAAPILDTVTVNFEPDAPKPPPMPVPMATAPGEGRYREVQPEAAAVADADDGLMARKVATIAQRSAEVAIAPFQALFSVPGRVDVASTGEAKRVQLLEEEMEPQLFVRSVPKIDAKAYLYAKLILPAGTPLLNGTVSLFRDGTFVGTNRVPLISPGEEHELGFGVDDLVKIRYAVNSEKQGETGLISTSKTDSRSYKITARNMHERAIGLVVQDQIPVSENNDIRVELTGKTAPTKQNIDDKRGVVAWELKLEPDQEQVVDFGYRVTWPSAKNVIYGR